MSQLMVRAATYNVVVNSDLDGTLAVLNGNGTCELREVIASANSYADASGGDCTFSLAFPADPLADDFSITFAGTVTNIELVNELPIITANVTIDGGGTVTLEEAAGQAVSYGLRFTADPLDPLDTNPNNSLVTGLTVTEFTTGIYIDNVPNVVIGPDNEIIGNVDGIIIRGTDAVSTVINGNFIGVDNASNPVPNTRFGIYILADASQTTITNNEISENGNHGIYNVASDNTQINNNTIDNNGGNGIYVVNSDLVNINNNTSISNNGVNGIYLNNSDDASITNNPIDGNGSNGILVANASSEALIISNTIQNNGADGVRVVGTGSQALIQNNLFITNGGLGIDLGANGVNPNDGSDADGGPNAQQNYPALTLAATDGATTTYIQGNFPTQAGVYDFIFYTSSSCDPSGYGEGEVIEATVGGNGPGAFTINIGATTVGEYLTVIAINQTGGAQGDTSEFSNCIPIMDDTFTVDFIPTNVTGVPGQTINFINQSTGIITGYDWTVTDPFGGTTTGTSTDFSHTFPDVGIYIVELCATPAVGAPVCVTTRVTIVAPTPTPTSTPAPILPTTIPTETATGTTTSTATTTPTTTATQTATTTSTSTLTATMTSTQTATMTSTQTATTTSTSTLTATMTSTQTATMTSTQTATTTQTSTQTATTTQTPTGTITPDIDVTLEDLDADTMGVNVFNASDFDVSDVELVIDPRSAVYSSTSGSFNCIESGGILTCTVAEIGASAFATQVIDCPENSNVNCSAQVSVLAGGAPVAVVNEPYIIKFGEPPVANAGAEIVYTIRVVNPLDEPVFDVVVTDRMPAVMRILDSEAAQGTLTIRGQDVLFRLDELDANDTVAFTITAQVRDDFVYNQIVNSACLTSSENPDDRCASMSFLRTGGLPATGEANFINALLRWMIVPFIGGLMLLGIWFFFKRLRHTSD